MCDTKCSRLHVLLQKITALLGKTLLSFLLLFLSSTVLSDEAIYESNAGNSIECNLYPVFCSHAELHLFRNQQWSFSFLDLKPVKILGEGIHGRAFLINNGSRPHVLKTVKPHSYGAAEGLENELEILSQLPSHPNIIGVKAYYTNTDGAVIATVMEKAKGSLGDKLIDLEFSSIGLSYEQALRYIKGIFAGLEVLHKQGIVHFDLHSSNLLIGEDDEIKIVDFSLAQHNLYYSTHRTKDDLQDAFDHALKICSYIKPGVEKEMIRKHLLEMENSIFPLQMSHPEHLFIVHQWVHDQLLQLDASPSG